MSIRLTERMAWWFKVCFFCSSSGKKSGSILEPFRQNISWRCRVRSDLLSRRFLREPLNGIIYSWNTVCVEGISMLYFKTYLLAIIVLLLGKFSCLQSVIAWYILLGAVYSKWFKTINRISIIPRNWHQTSDVHTRSTRLWRRRDKIYNNWRVIMFVCLHVINYAYIRTERG